VESLEGRVLWHREDEATGRVYMILEGTDQKVHFIYHTREVETARQRGKMKPNAFVQFIRRSIGGNTDLKVDDLGDSERLLSDQRHMRKAVQEIQKRRMITADNGWGGWLGKYERTLVETAHQIETERSNDKSGGQTKQNRLR